MLTEPANFPNAINSIDKIYHHLNKKIPPTIVTGTHLQIFNTIQENSFDDEFDEKIMLAMKLRPSDEESIYGWSKYLLYQNIPKLKIHLWPICGVELINEFEQITDKIDQLQKELAPHCSWWIPFKNHLFICDKPKTVCYQDGEFHNSTGPAIELRCGYKIYIMHNICVMEKVITQPESITINDIENSSFFLPRTTIYIQAYGLNRFLQEKSILQLSATQHLVELQNQKILVDTSENNFKLIRAS